MPSFLEFHDSRLLAVGSAGREMWLEIDGYVHSWERRPGGWAGTGWSRRFRFTLSDARPPTRPGLPLGIATGRIAIPDVTYENGVPLPFTCAEPAWVTLLLENGEELQCMGSRLAIEPIGDAEFVEDLPADMNPFREE